MNTLFTAILLLPTPIFAAVGGRCYGEWNTDRCICLDHNVCTNTYHGWAYQGTPKTKNWACPFDGNNVWGCEISPCPGKGRNATRFAPAAATLCAVKTPEVSILFTA
ncbi:hypothetical protein TEQG_03932 [Trichophyton equinum CBS 127.97]|uniref:Secreted protein n=1 Tax=Trichophyton equinum (strain ATCC MYA-4606 / CBS 127.97) TaxID=559882 RepID=F2PSI0_TRIEC|nr:hypothetical protein TEQG_03932 [Trichophyton equinum CBS 127.97]